MLENEAVAARLLEFSRAHGNGNIDMPQAVVYFSKADDILVQTSDGTIENLLYSPYVNQLDKCFVYLDEIHT